MASAIAASGSILIVTLTVCAAAEPDPALAVAVALPEPEPRIWREQVHQMTRDLHDILASHRDAALAGLGRIPTSPNSLRAAEALTAVLRAGGLSDRVTALGLDALVLFVAASAFEQGLMDHSGMTPEEIASYFAQVHAFYDRLPADLFEKGARPGAGRQQETIGRQSAGANF